MYLPYLVLKKIFSFFEIEEKFKLRIICKSWKKLIEFEANNQIDLLVYSDLYGSYSRCYSPHLIHKSKNKVDQKFFQHFCLTGNYFPNVKKLILFEMQTGKIEDDELLTKLKNFLVNLEELIFYGFYGGLTFSEFLYDFLDINNLNFTKLKKCSFLDLNLGENFNLNAPNLEDLSVYTQYPSYSNAFSFNCDQLKTLKCQYPEYFNQKFINLENLFCPFIDQHFDLLNYPKLKKLDFCPNSSEMPFIEKLFKQKQSDLEIVVYGFKISNIDENLKELLSIFRRHFDMMDLSIEFKNTKKLSKLFKLIKKNQLNLSGDYLSWPLRLECQFAKYNKLVIPYFLNKNLNSLTIYNLRDSKYFKNLIYFLTEIGGIQNLNFYKCNIKKEDRFLFKKVPFISALELYECEIEQNLEFLFQLNHLRAVTSRMSFHPIFDYLNILNNSEIQYIKMLGPSYYPYIIEMYRKIIRVTIVRGSNLRYESNNFDEILSFLKSHPETNNCPYLSKQEQKNLKTV